MVRSISNHAQELRIMATSTRCALVTGATSGIGQATAELLASQGIRVLISGRDPARGERVVAGIRSKGGAAEFVAADMASPQSVAQLAAEAERRLGGVDILVNNAGIYSFGPTADGTAEAFEAMYATNVKGPFLLTGRLAPAMAARRWGRVVNITTVVAYIGMAGAALYGSSKAALQLLTQAWAAEFGPGGVTVNSVSPGPIRTPGTAGMGEVLDYVAKSLPAGRVGAPDEVAAAVGFLVSERAAYVNGTTLAVDGGRVAV
jgi:NAD(P)-dependent dehydrogenase (short-subunit alcohol dehydrogenase family)